MKKIMFLIFVDLLTINLVSCGEGRIEVSKNDLYGLSVLSSINEIENPLEDRSNYDNENFFIKLVDDKLFNVTEEESDKLDYNNLLVVYLEDEILKMYFNETLIKEDIDDDEIEREFNVEGIVIYNEEVYSLIGKLKTEIEDKEEEYEIEVKISKEDNKYTIFKYEYEDELEEHEKSFEIKVYDDKKLIYSLQFEFEKEYEEQNIKLKIKTDDEQLNQFIKIKNNKGTMKIEKIINGVKIETRNYTITINDGVITKKETD